MRSFAVNFAVYEDGERIGHVCRTPGWAHGSWDAYDSKGRPVAPTKASRFRTRSEAVEALGGER